MKRILVTGANKGIGQAIVERILRQQPDCSVLLGARDTRRGNAAQKELLQINNQWRDRIDVLHLDVSSEQSVQDAAVDVGARYGSEPLFGLVNNAGVAAGDLKDILNVNVYGMQRVCTAFAPLLASGGRIVNITSASGPNFVAECSPDRQRFLTDAGISWDQLDAFMQECVGLREGEFAARGLGSGSSYGLSKACANAYTLMLARSHPQLLVNACTPGFIETDLTRVMTRGSGKSASELGMKSPAEGARVVLFLLFGDPQGTGQYYGSDTLRSPLDRYRAPGTPAYTGP